MSLAGANALYRQMGAVTPTVFPDQPLGLVATGSVDGASLTWDPPANPDTFIVVEIADNVGGTPGATWIPVATTRDASYFLSLTSGGAWVRLRALLYGRLSEEPADPAQYAVLAEPAQITATINSELAAQAQDILDNAQAIADEALLRAQEDARVAQEAAADAELRVNNAVDLLEAEIAVVRAQVADVFGADEYDPALTYPIEDLVVSDGKLYRALQEVPVNTPPATNPTYWELLGNYTSLGDAVSASLVMSTQNANDIAANSSTISAHAARLSDAEADILQVQGAYVAADEAMAQDITALQATVDDPVTGVDATAVGLSALTARVTTAEGDIDAVVSDVSALQAGIGAILGPELVPNWQFTNGNTGVLNSGTTHSVTNGELLVTASDTSENRVEWFLVGALEVGATYRFRTRARRGTTTTSAIKSFVGATIPTTSITSTVYAEYGFTFTATAVDLRIRIYVNQAGAAGDTMYVDWVSVKKVTNTATADAVNALDVRVTTAEGTISTHTSEITSLDSRLDTAEGTLTANGSAISALDVRLDAAEGTITSQSSDITALENSVYHATTGLATRASTTALNALTTRVTAAEGTISTHTSDITSLDSRLDTAEGTLTANGSAISALDTRLDAAEGTITSQSSDITALENSVYHATTGLATRASTTALNSLTTRVTAAEGTISTHTSDITSLDSRLDTAEGTLLSQGSAINLLDVRLDNAEGSITAQASDITALEVSVGNNTASITQHAIAIAQSSGQAVLLQDPGFEARDAWSSSPTTVGVLPTACAYQSAASSTDYVHGGFYAFRVNADASIRNVYNPAVTRVIPGKRYRVSFWTRSFAGAPAAASYIRATTQQYAGDMTVVSYAANVVGATYNTGGLEYAYRKVTGIYTVPAGVHFVRFAFQVVSLTTGTIMVDDYSVEGISDTEELAMASWSVTLDVNGYASGFTSFNNGVTSGFVVNAANFSVISTDNTRLQWEGATGVLYARNATHDLQLGAGFGSDADKLTAYFGPTGSAATRTLATAKWGITVSGKTKFGNTGGNYGSGWDTFPTISYSYGSGSDPEPVTINTGAGVFVHLGQSISYNAGSTVVNQVRGSGAVTYYLYYDDGAMTGGTKSLFATTVKKDQWRYPNLVFVGQAVVTVSPVGGGSGNGNLWEP